MMLERLHKVFHASRAAVLSKTGLCSSQSQRRLVMLGNIISFIRTPRHLFIFFNFRRAAVTHERLSYGAALASGSCLMPAKLKLTRAPSKAPQPRYIRP